MQKQKVFFFAADNEGSDAMVNPADLLQMASDYVNLYGESCLNDPETPSFVRRMLAKRTEIALPRAG